ncbi:hypothetical protein PTKIN_Ptkin14bG0066500 [Pterospermum kingtungense]
MVITLFNPFKDGISIHLPPLDFTPGKPVGIHYEIQKAVLSTDPSIHPDSDVVVVIYSVYCNLAFYKSWEKIWIYLDKKLSLITVIVFYRNLVYVIRHYNNVLSFDVNEGSESPKWKTVVPEDLRLEAYSHRAYIVESSNGYLCSIHGKLEFNKGPIDAYFTANFKVCKLILDDANGDLIEKKEVKSLDGDMVFVGDNGTIAVSALEFPQGHPNCIYFTDDFIDVDPYQPFGPRDIGIFNVKDGSFGNHYQFKPSHKDLPPYIWIQPPVEFK